VLAALDVCSIAGKIEQETENHGKLRKNLTNRMLECSFLEKGRDQAAWLVKYPATHNSHDENLDPVFAVRLKIITPAVRRLL
jgi:hypothetical protein